MTLMSQHLKVSKLRPTMFVRPHVAETTPVKRKYDEIPSADRRLAIRYCCGMLDTIVPNITIMVHPILVFD
jgi:hypothetical protein